MTVEEEKAAVRTVLVIEAFDEVFTDLEQRLESIGLVGVGRIGEQDKVQIPVAIGKKADLEDRAPGCGLRTSLRSRLGTADHGRAVVRNAFREIKFRQERGGTRKVVR
ncbi:MAG: hypothetical protein WKF37_09685 [Bryobacteraceae bacterium]